MLDAGIRTKKEIQYVYNEVGGIANAEFIEQDAHYFMRAHMRNMISSGDAQTMINHFMHLKSEDSNFFNFFQVDEDSDCVISFEEIVHLKLHYECFGVR